MTTETLQVGQLNVIIVAKFGTHTVPHQCTNKRDGKNRTKIQLQSIYVHNIPRAYN